MDAVRDSGGLPEGRVHPFRAAIEPFASQGDKSGVRVSLLDEGNGGRKITSTTAMLRQRHDFDFRSGRDR